MAEATSAQIEQLVDYVESHRQLISKAQADYNAAKSKSEKGAVLKDFATKKSALEASLPPRDARWCLASIGPPTIVQTVTVTIAVSG